MPPLGGLITYYRLRYGNANPTGTTVHTLPHTPPPVVSMATVLAVLPTLDRVTVRSVRAALGNRGSMRDIGRVLREVRKTPAEQLRDALAHKEKPPGDAIVDALHHMEEQLLEPLRQLQRDRTTASGVNVVIGVREELRHLRALIERMPASTSKVDDDHAIDNRLAALLVPWLARIETALTKQSATPAINQLTQRIQTLEQTVRQRDLELPAELRQLQMRVEAIGHQVYTGTLQIETQIAAAADTAVVHHQALADLDVRVANAHHDLVERHAHQSRRLAESEAARVLDAGHLHQHLAALRTDLANTAKAQQTEQRGQQTRLRRVLRDLALTQLHTAAGIAAAVSRRPAKSKAALRPTRRRASTVNTRGNDGAQRKRSSKPIGKAQSMKRRSRPKR